jgi:hypothetical protein
LVVTWLLQIKILVPAFLLKVKVKEWILTNRRDHGLSPFSRHLLKIDSLVHFGAVQVSQTLPLPGSDA